MKERKEMTMNDLKRAKKYLDKQDVPKEISILSSLPIRKLLKGKLK